MRDDEALRNYPVAELSRLYKLVNSLVEYHGIRNEKLPALEKKLADIERQLANLRTPPTSADAKEAKAHAKRLRQSEAQLNEVRSEIAELQAKIAAVDSDPELSKLAAAHSDIGQQVLQETARLHGGDPVNVELWREFLPACLADIEVIYKRLGVTFDHTLGESFYQDRLRGVVKDLADKGLARESDGAICVFLEGHEVPFIVQKQDGAFLYATSDLATIQYRMSQWRPDAILYVVDHRQSLHFEQLFAAARLWGYRDVELQHIAFGTVLGDDGRPFKTRSRRLRGAGRACWTKPSSGHTPSFRRTTTPGPSRCSRRMSGGKLPSGSASGRSNTPTCPTIAPATTCSATTRCWR